MLPGMSENKCVRVRARVCVRACVRVQKCSSSHYSNKMNYKVNDSRGKLRVRSHKLRRK